VVTTNNLISREFEMRVTALVAFAGFFLHAQQPVLAQTSRPAAPVVTAGANLKEITFDWDPVPGAYTYRLYEKKTAWAEFTPVGDRIPGSRTRAGVFVAAHLFDWNATRYAVAACNAAGCTRSAPVDPGPLMLDVIGYFKASNTELVTPAGFPDLFGVAMEMSSDGSTLVVHASGESSSASGVNGDQFNNDSERSGAVYVYRRDGRRWRQEAYLKDLVDAPTMVFGRYLAISGDGSWIAASGANETVDGAPRAGRVYLFHRGTDGTWTLQSILTRPQVQANRNFGVSLDMSEDGTLLKVGGAVSPLDEFTPPESELHFFERDGTSWQHSETMPTFFPHYFCNSRLSSDGLTLIAHCISVNGLGDPAQRMVTLKRIGGAWVRVHDLAMADNLGFQPVALDHHATRMALIEGRGRAANVVLHRWDGSAWVRELVLPPPATEAGEETAWGRTVQFSRNGRMVAISDSQSRIAGAGVMKPYARGTSSQGAVLVYQRAWERAPWRLRSVLKAPNPGNGDLFGGSVDMSGDGKYLAVGAASEDSNARGIDGDRNNNASGQSGAVYLY
jgi:trimeric autotransporter adhesin